MNELVWQVDVARARGQLVFAEFARRTLEGLIALALDVEITAFLARHSHLRDEHGSASVTRNGFLPTRMLQTDVGPVAVRVPRSRDRMGGGSRPRRRYTSRIIPRYARWRACDVSLRLPVLFGALAAGESHRLVEHAIGVDPSLLGPSFSSTMSRRIRRWRALLDTRDLSNVELSRCWLAGYRSAGTAGQPGANSMIVLGVNTEAELALLALSSDDPTRETSWSSLRDSVTERGLRLPREVLTHGVQTSRLDACPPAPR